MLTLTLIRPPDQFGATRWSLRLLATALGEGTPISHGTIAGSGTASKRNRGGGHVQIKVTEICTPGHRHQEFLAFLRQIAAAPRRQLHVLVDNLSTHTRPAIDTSRMGELFMLIDGSNEDDAPAERTADLAGGVLSVAPARSTGLTPATPGR